MAQCLSALGIQRRQEMEWTPYLIRQGRKKSKPQCDNSITLPAMGITRVRVQKCNKYDIMIYVMKNNLMMRTCVLRRLGRSWRALPITPITTRFSFAEVLSILMTYFTTFTEQQGYAQLKCVIASIPLIWYSRANTCHILWVNDLSQFLSTFHIKRVEPCFCSIL